MNSRHRFERFAARTFRSVLAAGALLAATSGIAAAAGLFDNPTQADLRTAAQVQSTQAGGSRDRLVRRPEGLRDRVVRVNAAELARLVPSGADNAANRLERARNLRGAVTLDLFPGVSVTAQRTDIEAPDEGGYIWAGEADGTRPAFVTLVINDNEIVGHIQLGGRLYSIEPVSGAVHRIIEIDQDKILDDMHAPQLPQAFQQKSEAAEPSPEAGAAKAKTTIKVLVGNTINARNECRTGTLAQKKSCMQARINLAISLANQAFTRSGVLISFARVGGVNEINYNDVNSYGAGSMNNYLGSLCDLSNFNCAGFGVANNQAAKFAALRNKREAVKADLVMLMRKVGAACGIAWVPDPPTATSSNQGFSVTTSTKGGVYNCIEGNTAAHESGHNMGLQHDRIQRKIETGQTPPKSKFNFGHVNKIKKFFTIMAYRTSCGNGCTRAHFFSTPLKNFNGAPLGIKQGVAGAADTHRTLNTTRTTVGNYRN